MVNYVIRRVLYMALVLVLVSMIAFLIIQLPPGDYLTVYRANQQALGRDVDEAELAAMGQLYGLDKPVHVQYAVWIWRIARGNLGWSFNLKEKVGTLIADRLPFTVLLSLSSLVFAYVIAIPIGIYSATHQYSIADFSFTFMGFVGLATPNFLLALIFMLLFNRWFGWSIGGLFSPEFVDAPWSWARVLDLIKHMPIPVLVIGTAGTGYLVRVMRGSLLDELARQYVITARAKGVEEHTLLYKYPVRLSINPIVSTVGWALAGIVSGETITAIVLGLETTGPLLFRALLAQEHVLGGQHHHAAYLHGGNRHVHLRHAAGADRPAHPLRSGGGLT